MRASIPRREQDQAIAALRPEQPGAPFPGAATSRLHGRYATLALAVQSPQTSPASLLVFHWELEFMQEFADATAHGDFWRVRIPLTQDWQARVQGYMTRAAVQTYLSMSADNYSNAGIGADPLAMTFTAYDDAGVQAIFSGLCWAQRGRVLAPQAMVTQELDLVGAQVPATISH